MDLHVFFLPFLGPGHMIPLVDIAKLFAARGIRSTVVTTPSNAPLIEPAIAGNSPGHPIHLLTLPFPPSVADNCVNLPNPDLSDEFMAAIATLRDPLDRLLSQHRPDCIVSDIFYPWTADLAAAHGIVRVGFNVTGAFASNIMRIISTTLRPGDHADAEDSPIVIPGIPHQVQIFKSQLPESSADHSDLNIAIFKAQRLTIGTVMNTFYELEPGYTETLSKKAWFVGPVALCDKGATAARGGKQHGNYDLCMDWLGSKSPGSVLYVCFGSLGKLTRAQLREAAAGLGDCDHPFIWAVKSDVGELLPEGFEDRITEEGKGLIVRGWAPQVAILGHAAVGGFVTHCGWNSCLEGVTAGVSMVTWPQFAEQFLNERLLVDVLGIGVAVGARVNSGPEERRTLVKAEAVTRAANEVMGGGEDAEGRRRRVEEMAAAAVKAMEEGGSSYKDLSRMIETLVSEKKKRAELLQDQTGTRVKDESI